ncbi:alpha/beta fold hydrolase [Streptomyces sedi]|uniref:Alpha/beta hydrolase n=1 Tax=Streptomyces sedi TaxID=555059 RepID=A0A5C4UW59_9ACTN|nr:alpha/beta hydrolase [Streptomyces sedi]TNM27768.1 alpha/beta hydrolase [Streptomyces sedi]
MPTADVNGIRVSYEDTGAGPPVVLISGTGANGREWDLHQVPALTAAGHRVVTFSNRGVPPTDECPEGFTVDDLVADTAALIEHVVGGPSAVVGTSLGAYVAQELTLARPELVTRAVFMATRGRGDILADARAQAEIALHDSGITLPPRYAAVTRAMRNLSPHTLRDAQLVADWLDLFEMSKDGGPGVRAQLALDRHPDRLPAYGAITVPCRVIAFEDDLLAPPHLGREVAEAVPGADFHVVPRCGHYGYLENPTAVNDELCAFLRAGRPGGDR